MKFNIEDKESIKMRAHIDLFSPCKQGAVVCLTTVFMAFSWCICADEKAGNGTAAQDSAASDVQNYEAEFSAEEKDILGLLSEAGTYTENKEFKLALEKLSLAGEKLEKFKHEKPGKTAVVLQEKYEIFAKDCRRTYAETMLQECRDEYINVISDKDLSAAAEKSAAMQKKLISAKFMYYMGVEGGDPQELSQAVSRDLKSDFAARADALASDFAKISNHHNLVQETSLSEVDPGYEDRQRDIQKLYREGETLYRNRRYTEARDKMEEILIRDPYNDRAIQMLTRIYRRLYFVADMRAYNELLNDQALQEWRWMENVPSEEMQPDQDAHTYADSSKSMALYDKTKKLVIPSIEVRDLGIMDAIDKLREKSKEIDSDNNNVGVQIMAIGLMKGKKDEKRVTFSFQNIPFLDAIRYLCLQTGLSFRINEKRNIIVIGPESEIAKSDTKEKVKIRVRHATVTRMVGGGVKEDGTESSDSGSSSGDGFKVEDGLGGMKVEDTFSSGIGGSMAKRQGGVDYSAKLKKYFEELGFQFPEGTYISYDSRKNEIEVNHTPEVLRQLQIMIREIDVDTPLILIEAKIMEIAMNDYEELGFDWTLSHENVNPNWSFTISSPLREPLGTDNTLINNMNILPNFGGDNVWSLFLTVNAIDRTDRAEVLSSPKLMAKNGEAATIRMVRQMYFPESWSEPEISTSCGTSVTLKPSVPEFGDARDVGIVFTATPTINPDNYTINLELAPSVVDLVGWSDYSYELVIGNFYDPDRTNLITMKMPELSRREVQTKVKVWDGQTVMIGGMLVDRQVRQDDRWPILGEVPLFGRLFSNDSTFIEKQNLLISVTSRLISGYGIPIRPNPVTGLPDFRR